MAVLGNWITTAEAAELIGVTTGAIRQMLLAGKFREKEKRKAGNSWLLARSAVLRIKAAKSSKGWPRGKKRPG